MSKRPIRVLPAAFAAGLAAALLAEPGAAWTQTVGSRIDRPTPGTLPRARAHR